eukprot:s2899_g18.t1
MRWLQVAIATVLFTSLQTGLFVRPDVGQRRPRTPCRAGDTLLSWIQEGGGDGTLKRDVDARGLRGLVVTKPARAGDILLEVPLGLTLADGCEGPSEGAVAAGPPWSKQLPWNVQLALGVLARRQEPDWSLFLDSWPPAPILPKDMEDEDLEEAQDEDFEVKAGGTLFWLEERYEDALAAWEQAEAADPKVFWSEEEFRWAMAHVWSRCCRLDLEELGGIRRLLIPLLDMGNHDSEPSAVFDLGRNGRAVCLSATRDLQEGDPVTYSYGEHPNEHFALYYGFVPESNPYDHFKVSLTKVLQCLTLAGFPGAGDWQAARMEEVVLSGVAANSLELRARSPPLGLLQALFALLPEASEATVLRAVAVACQCLEAEHPTTLKEDQEIIDSRSSELADGVLLLVKLRMERKKLFSSLSQTLQDLAKVFEESPEQAQAQLQELLASDAQSEADDAMT